MEGLYEGAEDSAWDRGQESIRRSRLPRSMPGFPSTLEKLLASPGWKGSTVETRGNEIVVRHPNGESVMRLQADVFERIQSDKGARDLERRQVEHRRAAKRAAKRTRHTPGAP